MHRVRHVCATEQEIATCERINDSRRIRETNKERERERKEKGGLSSDVRSRAGKTALSFEGKAMRRQVTPS
jgi:hypothetical protein